MIILTKDEADQVRGLTVKGHALAPVPLIDGTFVLPDACAADPAHAKHVTLLKSLPTRDVEATEFLASKASTDETPSTLTAAEEKLLDDCVFKSDWKEGEAIVVAPAPP